MIDRGLQPDFSPEAIAELNRICGAAEKGTWVRTLHPPVEGRLVHGHNGLKVGQKIHVKLVETDFERGYIDFIRI